MSKEITKTLTVRSLIIGVFLSIVFTYLFANAWALMDLVGGRELVLGGQPHQGDKGAIWSGVWAVILLVTAGNMLIPKKHRLTMAEMAFVISCIATTQLVAGTAEFGINTHWIASFGESFVRSSSFQEYGYELLSPLLCPKDPEVLNAMQSPPIAIAKIPWAAWMVPLIFQIVLFVTLKLFLFFGAAIIQGMYIDIAIIPTRISNMGNMVPPKCCKENLVSRVKDCQLGRYIDYRPHPATFHSCPPQI